MIPLNVTHTAIVTRPILTSLLSPTASPAPIGSPLPPASTRLRHMLSTLIGFFAESYKSTFGFVDGPPLHDALTIAYVSEPELFTCHRYRVDVELSGAHTAGETVVDVWNYRTCDESWGRDGKNCLVAEKLDVSTLARNLRNDCLTRCLNIVGRRVFQVVLRLRYEMRPSISSEQVIACPGAIMHTEIYGQPEQRFRRDVITVIARCSTRYSNCIERSHTV